MNTVTVLKNARAVIADFDKWTVGSLRAFRALGDGKLQACHCSVGAVFEVCDAFTVDTDTIASGKSTVIGCTSKTKVASAYEQVSTATDEVRSKWGKLYSLDESFYGPSSIPDEMIDSAMEALDEFGLSFPVGAVRTATKYLGTAARTLGASGIVRLNDGLGDRANHKAVLQMFDLAIRNAKRRHPEGGLKRGEKNLVAEAKVSQ